MAIVDRALSGDDSQDEAHLRRVLPNMFQSVAFTQMSLPLRPIFGAPQPTQAQTEQEGRLLLSEFVTEEIRRNHVILDHPEDDPEEVPELSMTNESRTAHHRNGQNCCGQHESSHSVHYRSAPSCSSLDAQPHLQPHCPESSSVKATQSRTNTCCANGRAQRMIDPTSLVYSHLAMPTSERIPEPEEVLQSHPMFREAGRHLSALADEFARSRERQQVRQQAENLHVNSITRENLMALMTELFHDGLSRERLVTLFFFCSDLIIKALRETQDGGVRWEILSWVWEFFCERVCAWVRDHGGWENVLGNYLPKAVMVTTGMAITAGIVFYIWKNWN